MTSAQDLTLGSKAPKLEVKSYVKGTPVKQFEKGKTYVVECWATWCGPCIKSIPHLTKLQKEHGEKLTIIGVAVMQDDPDEVTQFVEKMGDKMDYRVALDNVDDPKAEEGLTVKNWLQASEQEGIPASFIVNGDGLIAWMGHPMEMDEPLEKILAGKWNVAEEAMKIKELKAKEKLMQELIAKLRPLYSKFNETGDATEVLDFLDEAAKKVPEQQIQFDMTKFQILSSPKGNTDKALALAEKLLANEEVTNDPETLNFMAWTIVSPDREKKADAKLAKFALNVALKADNLVKQQDPSVADTVAKAYFDNGLFEKAVEVQERVVETAKGTELEQDPGIKKRLRQYRRALETSKSNGDAKPEDSKKE